ncbi:MAG: hypothetical protein ACI9FB_001028 [Candidatus Azotimanducaceae bacterium]|jgi:hypothetical protein
MEWENDTHYDVGKMRLVKITEAESIVEESGIFMIKNLRGSQRGEYLITGRAWVELGVAFGGLSSIIIRYSCSG